MLKNSHKICLHSNNHSEAGTVQGGAPYRVVKRKKCYAEEMCMGGKGRRNPATYICAEQRAFGTNSHRTIWPGERGEIKSLPTNTHRHSPIRTHLYLSYKMCLVNSLPMRDCTWPVLLMFVSLGLIAEPAVESTSESFRGTVVDCSCMAMDSHDNWQGELVCRNKSKGDVDLKELPVRTSWNESVY